MHAQLHNNANVNDNNMYLHRRRLNVEGDDSMQFNSDEEEEKYQQEEEKSFDEANNNSEPRLIQIEEDRVDEPEEEQKRQALVAGNEVQHKKTQIKQRLVPTSYVFLDANGKEQRNVPIFDLDEIWDIPDEFGSNDDENDYLIRKNLPVKGDSQPVTGIIEGYKTLTPNPNIIPKKKQRH